MSLYKSFFSELYEVSSDQAEKAIDAGEKAIDRLILKNPNMTGEKIKRAWKVYDAIVGLEGRMKEKKPNLPESYRGGGFTATKDDFNGKTQTGNTASDDPEDLAVRSVRISDILESNTPTSPDKWAKAKAAARAKFKVYPSAYANLWAAKKYKSMGGGWKKGKK
jgi:hypothetical protein